MTKQRSHRPDRPVRARFFPQRTPERLLARRKIWAALLVVGLVSLVFVEHLRHRPGPPAAALSVQAADLARYHNQTFRVVRVVDGDTVHIDASDEKTPYTIIRLRGIDTPEVHGEQGPRYFGPEASVYCRVVADGQFVRLELVPEETRDKYNRLLAYIFLPDGTMLNEHLIAQGYAYADTRFAHPRKARFSQAEQQARRGGLGLWGHVTTEQMPAWRQKKQRPATR